MGPERGEGRGGAQPVAASLPCLYRSARPPRRAPLVLAAGLDAQNRRKAAELYPRLGGLTGPRSGDFFASERDVEGRRGSESRRRGAPL